MMKKEEETKKLAEPQKLSDDWKNKVKAPPKDTRYKTTVRV